MIELQSELPKTGVYETASILVTNFLIDLKQFVRKAETGMRASGTHPSQNDTLERAYFHDIMDLLFDRAAADFGKLLRSINPVTLRQQLRDDLIHTVRRQAHRIMVDSELSGTELMDEFFGLLPGFLSNIERESRCPQIAA